MNEQTVLSNYVHRIVGTLINEGVTNVVISPGSRSTPLAYAFAARDIRVYRQVDERSAAFFALGLAKAIAKPVVLLCTSGTAAANYFPAIVEANYARVPLIVLTADRPHELREVGAPQTINQINLYGNHVKWHVDFPIPDEHAATLPFIERHVVRAVTTAMAAPFGPVHINVPFREPLLIDFEAQQSLTYTETFTSHVVPTEETAHHFGKLLREAKKGLLIIGELPLGTDVDILWSLVRRLRWPVLIEALSLMRSRVPSDCAPYVITAYDALLKEPSFAGKVAPTTVVRFGAQPISKFVTNFLLSSTPKVYVVVDEAERFRESSAIATHTLRAEISNWLDDLPLADVASEAAYAASWQRAEQIARACIKAYDEKDEGAAVRDILQALPNGSDVFVSNSMPVRDIDTFFIATKKDIRIFSNRGANGIDGIVSTALGMSSMSSRPMYLLIGDLALLHDTNGFIATRYQHASLTTIVMNNDGGGIFSYLPQAKVEAHYEDLFGTPTALTFAQVAKQYNMAYDGITYESLHAINWHDNTGLRIVEIMTNRLHNTRAHRTLWATIAEAIR